MDRLSLGVILATVTLSAVAQLALKAGLRYSHVAWQSGSTVASFVLAVASAPLVWVGLIIYGLSVVAWLWVLTRIDVSVAYPFVGISFILTSVFGALILNEQVTLLRAAGTLLVVCGCVLIARSA